MTGVIEGFRWGVLRQQPPSAMILLSVGVALFFLFTGLFYFRRVEKTFAFRPGRELDEEVIPTEAFEGTPSISVDYAIMEPALEFLAPYGPDLRNGMTNHAPMAVEA